MGRLHARSNGVATVNRKGLTLEVLVRYSEKNSLRHILIPSSPASGHLLLVLLRRDETLLVLVATVCRHLAGEDTGRNAVHADLEVAAGELGGKHAGKVDGGAFAGVVAEVVLGGLDEAGDGGDEENGGGPLGVALGAGLKEGEEGGGHEVLRGDVYVVDIVPVGVCDLVIVEQVGLHLVCVTVALSGERCGGDTGIVDEDVESLLAGLNLLVESLNTLLVGDICGDGDDLAGDVLAVLLNNGVKLLLGAAGDVDLGAVDSESLSGHKTQTRATACEEGY